MEATTGSWDVYGVNSTARYPGPQEEFFERVSETPTHNLEPSAYNLDPRSETLNPKPYTLYPKPHTLYPIPYTRYPIPDTLYPIPYNLYPTSISYTLHRTVEPRLVTKFFDPLRSHSYVTYRTSTCFEFGYVGNNKQSIPVELGGSRTNSPTCTWMARRVQNLFLRGNTGSMASCSRTVDLPALSSPRTTMAGGVHPSRTDASRSRRGSR